MKTQENEKQQLEMEKYCYNLLEDSAFISPKLYLRLKNIAMKFYHYENKLYPEKNFSHCANANKNYGRKKYTEQQRAKLFSTINEIGIEKYYKYDLLGKKLLEETINMVASDLEIEQIIRFWIDADANFLFTKQYGESKPELSILNLAKLYGSTYKKNFGHSTASLLTTTVHEMQHIKQFAEFRKLFNGEQVEPKYRAMFVVDNLNYIISGTKQIRYKHNLIELDAHKTELNYILKQLENPYLSQQVRIEFMHDAQKLYKTFKKRLPSKSTLESDINNVWRTFCKEYSEFNDIKLVKMLANQFNNNKENIKICLDELYAFDDNLEQKFANAMSKSKQLLYSQPDTTKSKFDTFAQLNFGKYFNTYKYNYLLKFYQNSKHIYTSLYDILHIDSCDKTHNPQCHKTDNKLTKKQTENEKLFER